MASLAKPQGAGDTKKLRRLRKKMEGKAAQGSITTISLLKQCWDVGVFVKPLLTLHLERHGHRPTLAAKETRQLVLHCASRSPAPRFAEIRNAPAVRATLVVSVTGAAVSTNPTQWLTGDASPSKSAENGDLTVPSNALDGFSPGFKEKFRLCAGLRISSGGSTGDSKSTGVAGGSWLKSLADAFLYAPLGEDKEACPDRPFSGKKRKTLGKGGRKKRNKGDARRRRRETENQSTVEDGDTRRLLDENDVHGVDNEGQQQMGVGGEHIVGEKGDGFDAADGSGSGVANLVKNIDLEADDGGGEVEADEGDDGEESSGEEDNAAEAPLPAIELYTLTPTQLQDNGFPLPCSYHDGKDNTVPPIPDANLTDKSRSPSLVRVTPGDTIIPTEEEAKLLIESLPPMVDLVGHVQTQPLLEQGGAEMDFKVFGLDCEMCLTDDGMELTRVTLVDADHKVVLDELVKPLLSITDYVTRWSGITAQLLENVDTRLCQIQAMLLRIVGADDILVGHSLENDLKALKVVHLRCVDTSLLYPHPKKTRRSSLRFLVSMYLQRTIQESDQGHNSAEDAIAALELAQLKVSKGPNFGAERCPHNIFERLGRDKVPCTMVASSEQCRRHTAGTVSAVPTFSDDGVVQAVLKEIRKSDNNKRTGLKPPLLWAELEGPKCPTIQQVSAMAGGGFAKVRSFLAGMDAAGRAAGHERRIMRLLNELPPGVTVVVASQGVNPELPRKLEKQRKVCEDRRCASVWSTEQERLLEALEASAREGCVFVAVT